MNARRKLNIAYFHGAVLLAAAVGVVARSQAGFWLALTILIGGGLHAGEIRTRPRGR